jgi:site-specific DNA-cytosine methylase
MLFLELFSRTQSASKVAAKRKYRTITVDNDARYNPTIVADILRLDYKKLETPDFIWASPPCNSFSNLALSQRPPSRDKDTFKALTETGRLGDRLLARTLKIIRYFERKNPKLKWVIENPHAMMRKQPSMKNFDFRPQENEIVGGR